MYAIAFDLDISALQKAYEGDSWQNAYDKIRSLLKKRGFERKQGSVYFGNEETNEVTCILAVQELAKTFSWFAPSVQDIRILQILGNSDLRPAIDAVVDSE